MNKFALITGASQGLGRAFAFEFAKRKTNLLLVSLPNEGLTELASELADFQVVVHCFETDLSLRENVQELATAIHARYSVSVLVNNAGRGGTQQFDRVGEDYLVGILDLNITATVLLTKLLMPNLRSQEKAYILNVSSMAAFTPIGFKTVYPASKAFIRHWSLGLREELRGSNVSVSIVYPGPMKTNNDVTQRIERQGLKGRLGLVPPERVASLAVAGMLAGRASIVPGFGNRWLSLLMALVPQPLAIKWASRAIEKELRLEK